MVHAQEIALHEGSPMNDAGSAPRGPEMGRWIMVALVILAGLALFFWFASRSQPVAPPAGAETAAP